MKNLVIATLFLVTTLLGGCAGSAQVIGGDATGGRIELRGPYMPAMSEARAAMLEHCHGRFMYEEQRESFDFQCVGRQAREPVLAAALTRR